MHAEIAPVDLEFRAAVPDGLFRVFLLGVDSCQPGVDAALAGGVLAGVPLGKWYPDLSDCLLVAVTEKRTKQEIGMFAEALESVL